MSCKKNKGASAKLLLDGCRRNNEVWYEKMGKNLRLIEDLAVSEEFEDDEDFLVVTFTNVIIHK